MINLTRTTFNAIESSFSRRLLLADLITHWEEFCHNDRRVIIDCEFYPEALKQAKWKGKTCREMCYLWKKVCYQYDCRESEAMHMFFMCLDRDNRERLLNLAFKDEINTGVCEEY